MAIEFKKYNTFRVIKKIVRDGPISKKDIGDSLLLTNASVLKRTNELQEKGLVISTGYKRKDGMKSAKGRLCNLLDASDSVNFVIGFLVEKNSITGVLSTLKLKVLEKVKYNISKVTMETASDMIKNIYDELLNHSCIVDDVIIGSSVAVSDKCFRELGAEKIADRNIFDEFQKILQKKIHNRFYVTSVSSALGVYYFDKYFSARVTPQRYKVMLFDFRESQTVAYVQFYTGLQFVDIIEQNLRSCIIRYDYSEADALKEVRERTLFKEISPENIIRSMYEDEELSEDSKKICAKAIEMDMYDYYLKAIGQLLAIKDPVATSCLKCRLSGLAILLYNMFSTFKADKIVVTNFVLSDYLLPIFKDAVFEMFGERIYNMVEFIDDDEAVLGGAAIQAFNSGFISFYYG